MTKKKILYIRALLLDSGRRGTFVFPISTESITSLLEDSYVGNEGWAYLMDSEGQVLLTISSSDGDFALAEEESSLRDGENTFDTVLDGRQVKVIRSVSEETGLTFVAVIPKESIAVRVTAAQRTTLLLLLAAILIGIVGILSVSWYRGSRIDGILQMLFQIEPKEPDVTGDEMVYISNSLKQLIESNTDLRDSVREKEGMTRSLILLNLLNGGPHTGTEEELEDYGIHLRNSTIFLIAFQIFSEPAEKENEAYAGETLLYKQTLEAKMEERIQGTLYMCDTELNSGCFICTQGGILARRLRQSCMRRTWRI